MPAIITENLTKRYRNGVTALEGVTLQVEEGGIFSLLGPNGAGKSTLIRILSACCPPTSGTAWVGGLDVKREPAEVRGRIACVPQNLSVDNHLTVEENMLFQGRLYRVERAKARMRELAGAFGLEAFEKRPAGSLSGGIRRRLDIAMRMMSRPRTLFLDEPTTGLDIQSRKALWTLIRGLRDGFGATVFLTTHYLEEAEALSDTLCVMDGGRVLAVGTLETLGRYLRRERLDIRFYSPEEARQYARGLEEALGVRVEVRENALTGPGDAAALQAAGKWLFARNAGVVSMDVARPGLEEIFLALTGKEAGK